MSEKSDEDFRKAREFIVENSSYQHADVLRFDILEFMRVLSETEKEVHEQNIKAQKAANKS